MKSEIQNNNAVVFGMGYVGLPLIGHLVEIGYKCFGIDSNPELIKSLNNSVVQISTLDSKRLLEWQKKGLEFHENLNKVPQADVYIICVPTPLDKNGKPDLSFVIDVGKKISTHISSGVKSLIILESTSYPGTTEEVLKPALEGEGLKSGVDFNLCFSSERVDPGNFDYDYHKIPKVIGGLTESCLQAGIKFYEKFIDTIVPARSLKEAETSKLLENIYRQVNIALVNELLMACNEMNINFWNVIQLSKTKPYGFQYFEPGPGVGGHCIPIDPIYFDYKFQQISNKKIELINVSQRINEEMPNYVVTKILENIQNRQKKILIIGITYKKNVKDLRESPALKIMSKLVKNNIEVVYIDPFIDTLSLNKMEYKSLTIDKVKFSEISVGVLLQDHDYFYEHKEIFSKINIINTRGSIVTKKFGMEGKWLEI